MGQPLSGAAPRASGPAQERVVSARWSQAGFGPESIVVLVTGQRGTSICPEVLLVPGLSASRHGGHGERGRGAFSASRFSRGE